MPECGGCQNIIPLKNSPHLHDALSIENVKWYFRKISYNGWSIVCWQPEQLYLSSRHDLHLHRVHFSSSCKLSWVDLTTLKWTATISGRRSLYVHCCSPVAGRAVQSVSGIHCLVKDDHKTSSILWRPVSRFWCFSWLILQWRGR